VSAPRPVPGAFWRLLRALRHVLRGLWIIRSEFGRLTPEQTRLVVRTWTRQMLDILGVALDVRGSPPAHGPLLIVANHISWLDILIMNAAQPARFVSKADVRRWPVLGPLIDGAGTLYIERESRRDAMRVVHQVAERLRTPDLISVFPEGTTGDGRALLPFHANLLQAAIATGAPVLPVGLRYVDRDSGDRSDAPLFIGDTTLIRSIWNTVRAQGVQAVVHYGQPQHHQGRERRAWAQDLRTDVARLAGLEAAAD
jgi:1-acyl-sn-glycerol-3-phosphate acyltransferase